MNAAQNTPEPRLEQLSQALNGSMSLAMQQALMPYEHLLPERLRGRNERLDEPFSDAAPARASAA